MPCFIRVGKRLGLSIPGDIDLTRFLEEKLMERFSVSTHRELEKALEEAYRRDSEALKRLLQELVLFYRLQKKREAPVEKAKAVEAYIV